MPSPPHRVLIADAHSVWRRGLRSLLDAHPDLLVVAEAADGEEALRHLREGTVDVVVIDPAIPGTSSAEVARTVRKGLPHARLLALSSGSGHASELLQSGASGYLLKDQSADQIVEAVCAVARGSDRWFVTPQAPSAPAPALSEREREVILLLADGRSNGEIAEALSISENTVRNHLANAYAKIGASTAREALAWAWRTGFVRMGGTG